MDRTLNREILRLSVPSILANLTVPLVGLVDTAVAGHLPSQLIPGSSLAGAAAFIGAISVGSMLFNLLYWNFSFLRTGTGGLTAQSFGRRDMAACGGILIRGLGLSLALSILAIALRTPFVGLVLGLMQGSEGVELLARDYFFIRIWAAPATLSLMAFSGWFVGMQDSMSSMWKDLVVNGVNIVASIFLSLGAGDWEGLGFRGIALGTVVAQYSGLLFCILVCIFKYRRKVFDTIDSSRLKTLFRAGELRAFFKMNADLLIRSVFFTTIYIGFTVISARYGDMVLASGSLMMQILMIFSYFTDGFAYAGEALSGRFIGAGDSCMLRRTVRYTFAWSLAMSGVFIFVYQALGTQILGLLTSDSVVVEFCRQFLPWLALMPPLGCAAFTWDGIYLGATASRGIRDAMAAASAAFFGIWFAGSFLLGGSASPQTRLHLLLGAYFAHLLARTLLLSFRYKKDILIKTQ